MLNPLNNNLIVELIEKNNTSLLINENKTIREGKIISTNKESSLKEQDIIIFDISKAIKYENIFIVNEQEIFAKKEG